MKKNLLLLTVALLSFLQFQSCKKDNISGPEVQTISVTPISTTAAIFKGNIVSKGDFNTLDYGFIYGPTPDVNEINGTKVSLGKDVAEGEFSKEVRDINTHDNYGYQSLLYVRAYLTDDKGTALGKMVQVTMPSPQAGSINPSSGKSGDIVKITGKFYSSSADAVEVIFNTTKAKVISVSDTVITAEIPSGILGGHGYQINVEVNVNGQKVTASSSFTILANIKDFSPKSGPIGTFILFSGDNLPDPYNYQNNLSVYFGEVPGNIVYGNTFQVPVASNVTKKTQVSISINGVKTVLPGEFTVTPPEITSISPESGLPGTSFTIFGNNFPTYFDQTITSPVAKIGDIEVALSPDYQGDFYFNVPEGMAPGDYTLTLKSGPNTVTAPKKLKILTYSITGFSPVSGVPGKTVNISGNFIKDQSYSVYFGAVGTSGYASSATNLTVQVPGGINEGNVKIYFEAAGKKFTAAKEFKIIGPSITSFSPASGIAGTIVTIKGEGFISNDYSAVVKFGTIVSPILNITENTITVAVPSNLNPGAMKISFTSNGQTVTSTANFTATN